VKYIVISFLLTLRLALSDNSFCDTTIKNVIKSHKNLQIDA